MVIQLRIKNPDFDAAFWETVDSLTVTSSRKKEAKCLTKKQVLDKYDEDAEEMLATLPSRRHPSNKKIQQWLDTDEIATISVDRGSAKSTRTSKKLDKDQALGVQDAMDFAMDDETMDDVADGFKSSAVLHHSLADKSALPSHIRRALLAKHKEPGEPDKKNAMATDKRSVNGDNLLATANKKLCRLLGLCNGLKLRLRTAAEDAKKARYPSDQSLLKEVRQSVTCLGSAAEALEKNMVERKATVQMIRKAVELRVKDYQEASRLLALLANLHKGK